MATAIGVLCVVISGLWTGSSAWPLKLMRKYQFEHWWFLSIFVGLFLTPWIATFVVFPHAIEAYRDVPVNKLILSNIFSLSWGVANILCGLCYIRIGIGMTQAILTGLGVSVATTLPLIYKGSGLFKDAPDITSPAGLTILCGVAVMIAGVIIASVAGFGRDRELKKLQQTSGSFLGGLIMTIIAGITSAGMVLAFVYAQGPIVSRMCLWESGTPAKVLVEKVAANHKELSGSYTLSADGLLTLPNMKPIEIGGLSAKKAADKIAASIGYPNQLEDDPAVRVEVKNLYASFPVWAVGLMGGVLVNLIFPIYLLIKNRSFGVYLTSPWEFALSIIMGLQALPHLAIYGTGMLLLGAMGASIGAGIQQAMQMIGGQGLGFISGEWKGGYDRPRRQMYLAIVLLIVASLIMVYSNQLK
jgi:hypothetical protein